MTDVAGYDLTSGLFSDPRASVLVEDDTPLPATDIDSAAEKRLAVTGKGIGDLADLSLPFNPQTILLFYGGNLTVAKDLFAGYLGIGVCEYYLRTGDESVLPLIKEMSEVLKATMYNGGWSGRGKTPSFTYSTGTGQMHAAGVHCVTFLLLAKMCGVDVDEYMLQKSLKTFYRFAGHDNVPCGDGWPEGGFRDNGKTAGLAIAMAAAARLTPEGESSIYAKARDHSAMKSFYATSWFHAAHTGGGIGEIWHHAAMASLHEKRPVQYRSYMDTRRWVMELSRRHDGTIGIAGMHDRYDKSASEHERSWGTYFALTYTLPRKKLQLFGAPNTKWCESYELPARPWGRPADDVFVSLEPAENPYLKMKHILNEVVPRNSSLPFLMAIRETESEIIAKHRDTILDYMKHDDWFLRTAAIEALLPIYTNPEHYKAVMPLMFKTLSEFTTNAALDPVRSMEKSLKKASPSVKAFAFEELKKVYAAIPEKMRFPGGQVVPNGADVVRSRIALLIKRLPGGEAYVEAEP